MKKHTKTLKAKEPIRLRFRELANGNKSIHLDCYTDGKRQYEFLKLYLIPERTPQDKEKNAETLRLAKAIQAQKIVELQNEAHGFNISGGKRGKANLIDFIDKIMTTKRGTTKRNYINLSSHLTEYAAGKIIMFKQIDNDFVSGFIKYLKTAKNRCYKNSNKTISNNTQGLYYILFATVMKLATKEDYLKKNPIDHLRATDKPQQTETETLFLNIEELQQLINTKCGNENVKNAFIFSCYCGLRISDIKGLKWENIHTDKKQTSIYLKQQKTQAQNYIPLSVEALQYLPQKGISNTIFDLPTLPTINNALNKWSKTAGINKHLTFHVARHTHATLLLTLGADIYTVSKLLGHKKVTTTQIYAKIIDEKKRAAVNLIPKF